MVSRPRMRCPVGLAFSRASTGRPREHLVSAAARNSPRKLEDSLCAPWAQCQPLERLPCADYVKPRRLPAGSSELPLWRVRCSMGRARTGRPPR